MKIHEAAELALNEIGQPAHLSEIRRQIEENGYFEFGAASPETALGVQLSRYSRGTPIGRRPDGEAKFYRAAPATYGLLTWLTAEERRNLELDEVTADVAEQPELDASLFLERELHEWLYKNLQSNGLEALGYGPLTLYDPAVQSQRIGKYPTSGAGEMDMLLVTPEGNLLVIELKRRSTDITVGQLCRYLGFVKTNLCSEGQIAYGLILAMEFSESMQYALAMVSAISARTISFQIKVDSVAAF
jgi:hypothetical protein